MSQCDFSDPYRRTDGQCNNPINPLLGSSFTPQQRVLPNAYDNRAIDSPRTRSVDNSPLPSARTVSNRVFQGMTPVSARGSMKPTACFIIPVNIENRDHFFPNSRPACTLFVTPKHRPFGCQNGVREQINERTSFVDGSMIYGSDSTNERLAEHVQNILPPHPQGCPAEIQATRDCFVAGDHRQSETPILTVPHITWLRRHKLIADALRNATAITNDEILFQETKRIVIAELQHVTYNEFLPAVLDNKTTKAFILRSRRSGHVDNYNPFINHRTINAFGVAAYRIGHSLVRNTLGLLEKGRLITFPVQKHFEVPDLMYEGGYERMARWMSREPKSLSDRLLVDGIRNRLFENFNFMGPSVETTSLDLGALLGVENTVFRPTMLTDSSVVSLEPTSLQLRVEVFRHPDDIDLFAGGMSETPDKGSILGPTFQCLIAYQFSLYKQGDRFWYERKFQENPVAAFTRAELAEIKKTTYSKILCSVMNNIGVFHSLQPRLMLRSNIRG
eukprot:XP_019927032.1 PREDICTED: peroxidase-like protein [Crassostrea gigas]